MVLSSVGLLAVFKLHTVTWIIWAQRLLRIPKGHVTLRGLTRH